MDFNIFKSFSQQIENELLKNLSKDYPQLSEDELKIFIYKKTRKDINKPNIDYKNRFKNENELLLDKIIIKNNETINKWKRQLLNRYGQDKECNYYIMLEFVKTFKNITHINIDNNMNKEQLFQETYKLVFQPYHNKDNADRWKQKKFRLKKKMLEPRPNEEDYEYILFNYLQDIVFKNKTINI
jgi:hypothetical protein